jgi:hypothetical protein
VAATYITMAELRALLGISGITLYTDATVEEVCQATEDILNKYLWFNTAPISATALSANVATIWQARQAPGASITTVDGFIASPYQLGNTLIAKVRGLIAPYMSPNSMVG